MFNLLLPLSILLSIFILIIVITKKQSNKLVPLLYVALVSRIILSISIYTIFLLSLQTMISQNTLVDLVSLVLNNNYLNAIAVILFFALNYFVLINKDLIIGNKYKKLQDSVPYKVMKIDAQLGNGEIDIPKAQDLRGIILSDLDCFWSITKFINYAKFEFVVTSSLMLIFVAGYSENYKLFLSFYLFIYFLPLLINFFILKIMIRKIGRGDEKQ